MSKLNLWFCVLRAFNVIAGAFALVKDFMRNMEESYRNCKQSWLLPMNCGKSRNERFALNLLDEMPVIKKCKVIVSNRNFLLIGELSSE